MNGMEIPGLDPGGGGSIYLSTLHILYNTHLRAPECSAGRK